LWQFVCPTCGYEFSTLEPEIQSGESAITIDEPMREAGLKDLREHNFPILIDRLAECGLAREASVLDVGSAHGWFLKALVQRGYKAHGIEPDREMAAMTRAAGLDVYEGFFPDDLPEGEQYNAITFNDVFEHLPHIDEVARHCIERLKPGGLLLINSPNTQGAFYRIARLTRLAGIHGLWDRMWQKGLPSPHLSYFSIGSLVALLRRTGFSEATRFVIQVDQAKGSWSRIRYTGMAFPAATIVWAGLLIARPIMKMLPSDFVVVIFRK
jgi:SAM-dependent methyltransferase